ncbi:hypothetical protein [Clostridium sp. E02]|uniref:hypothetical protein n=1 Tax=Clostridium sp. E02 TaxID=2487134 RepID=UPI000F52ACB1|nr:hypothetical protein [Clostridium sp. E02]
MNELLNGFYEQYNYFFKEIVTNDKIRIGTLGPCGTSSEQALKYLSCFIKKCDKTITIETSLKNNFLDVYDALNRGLINYALIPTAYERVTDFYWNNRFVNNLNFIFPTPEYGLVCKSNYVPIKNRKTRIACCPAVENIIEYLSNGELKNEMVEKVKTNSTTEAVICLINDEVDLAITNRTSFNHYSNKNIKFISKTYNAIIVWSLFKQKDTL